MNIIQMRRLLRHHFQYNLAAKWSYNVATWFISLTFIMITCTCIVSLHLKETIQHLRWAVRVGMSKNYILVPSVTN